MLICCVHSLNICKKLVYSLRPLPHFRNSILDVPAVTERYLDHKNSKILELAAYLASAITVTSSQPPFHFFTMGRRRKNRTHLKGGVASAPGTAEGVPKSFVIKHGQVGRSLAQLVRDMRKVMEPNTATRLRVSTA